MQRIGNRFCLRLPHQPAGLGIQVLHLALHLVELPEVFEGVPSNLALVGFEQVEELAPRMRQASALGHALGQSRLVARVVVAHQLATPAVQERLGILARTRLGKVVDDGFDVLEGPRAVRPQVRAVCLAVARFEHRHRCLVGVEHLVRQDNAPQRIDDWLQLDPAHAHPLAQRRARDREAGPPEDRLLAVQGKVVRKLGHHYLGKQPWGGHPLVDHLGRHRRLDKRLALGTRPLAADVTLDREDPGFVGELLRDVLADALHRATAAAVGRFRLVRNDHPRQVRGQRFTPWPAALLGGRCGLELLELLFHRRQIRVEGLFKEAALRGIELLARAIKAQALVARQLKGQLLDARALKQHLALERLDRIEKITGRLAQLRFRERLKIGDVEHAPHAARAEAVALLLLLVIARAQDSPLKRERSRAPHQRTTTASQ